MSYFATTAKQRNRRNERETTCTATLKRKYNQSRIGKSNEQIDNVE